jgi:putative ABC transport system permease protein
MAMSARERTSEYVVFKTLGFGSYHLAGLIFGESFVITLTGGALGILATFPAAKAFGDAMSTFLPVFFVSPRTVYLDVLASVIVATSAAIIPAVRVIHIGIAEGLRKVA